MLSLTIFRMTGDVINSRKYSTGSGPASSNSVFEAHLNRRQYEALKQAVERLLEPAEDSVRYYALCSACVERVEVPAVGDITSDPQAIVV